MRMIFHHKRYLIVVLLCLLVVSACTESSGQELAQTSPLSVWIDAPLDGSVLSLSQQRIIAHGSDGQGIRAVEFSVNDAVLDTETLSDASQHLVTVITNWLPVSSGVYKIGVRAQNGLNVWSDPAVVVVQVLSDEDRLATQQSPTPSPTITLTPTASATPTAEPTATNTPSPTPTGSIFSDLSKTTDLFYYRFSDCPNRKPNDIYFEIIASDPAGINHVEFFYRVQEQTSNEITEWRSFVMTDKGEDRYTALLDADDLASLGAGAKVWLQYQFISNNLNGEIYRSPVYSDVTVKGCRD